MMTRSTAATPSSGRSCGATCAGGSRIRTSMTWSGWCSWRGGGAAAASTRRGAGGAGPEGRDIASRVEQRRDMQVALARLPDLQREAIEMAYYADLTRREIARRLDVPLGTIKARTARGLRRLGGLIVSPAAV